MFNYVANCVTIVMLTRETTCHTGFHNTCRVDTSKHVSLTRRLHGLSLNFLNGQSPNSLSSVLVASFAVTRANVSRCLPRLVKTLIVPMLTFISLL